MWKILITPARAGSRIGEIHISRRSHDEMLWELLTHPSRPMPQQFVPCCVKHRVVSLDEAHEFVEDMADAFWICWCDDPAQYRG